MELIEALLKPENWRPILANISKDTGTPISTVQRQVQKRIDNGQIKVVIKCLSEAEALEQGGDKLGKY